MTRRPLLVAVAVLAAIVSGCESSASSTIGVSVTAATTLSPNPPEKTIVVISTADSGPGTLRQALTEAETGDTITFDPEVFSPESPATIHLRNDGAGSALPELMQGRITLDAGDAGVILDGRECDGEWVNCLHIRSNGNVIRGLQIVNFPGSAIGLMDGAQDNTIGGDRTAGSGPVGEGNLASDNYVGISLQGTGTSRNAVIGNLIGTGPDGTSDHGNDGSGVYLDGGANHNTIGPDNIVAFNGEGVQVYNPDSVGNTITRNSIHDNDTIGILLNGEGNTYTDPPDIIGYDVTAGTATLFAAAGDIVELYSDEGSQGRVFEGGGTADSSGVFVIDKGTSFGGPHLTAFATDEDGNSSGFSLPTSDLQRPVSDTQLAGFLQVGNARPRTELVAERSEELDDNKFGTFSGGPWWRPDREPELFPTGTLDAEYILRLGFKRFRFGINCLDPGGVVWDKPDWLVDPAHDEFVTALAEAGVELTFVLSFWDVDYKSQGGEIPIPRFKTEAEISRYLDYVRFMVDHFKDRVEYYEIWNEPNFVDTIQAIEVKDYIALVKRVAPVIREEYPGAKIVVGGTSSLIDEKSQAYLFEILESDVMPLVDVVSWHPMYGSSPEYDEHRTYYYQYPSLVQTIKDTATAHGFKGEYQADEIHWPIPTHPEAGWPTYSSIQGVKYLARSVVMHRGSGVIVTELMLTGSKRLRSVSSCLSTIMAGAQPTNVSTFFASPAAHPTSYGFSLPDGDKLLALWDDGVAADYDPGIPATLTIPGFAGWTATGIDPLNGFEQELVSATESADLVIRDFLLKDYPIVIRLAR